MMCLHCPHGGEMAHAAILPYYALDGAVLLIQLLLGRTWWPSMGHDTVQRLPAAVALAVAQLP
jgi:hypothetical protein